MCFGMVVNKSIVNADNSKNVHSLHKHLLHVGSKVRKWLNWTKNCQNFQIVPVGASDDPRQKLDIVRLGLPMANFIATG